MCILAVAVIGIFAFLRQPSFGKLPSGERLERIRRSPNYQGGQFRNLQPTAMMTGKKSRWQALWEFVVSDRSGLYPEKPVPSVKTDLKQLPRTENLMVWFGHSSYLLLMDGKRFLVDPVFHAASPVPFINRPFSGTDIYKPEDMPDIDYLVITHDHWDHLDYRTVVALKERVHAVICPLGVGEHFEYWGYDPHVIREMDWQETAPLDADHIFDRFYKRSEREGATGLGLALVGAIARYYSLKVDYSFVGGRHIFTVLWPR